jgi:hypothetical protein
VNLLDRRLDLLVAQIDALRKRTPISRPSARDQQRVFESVRIDEPRSSVMIRRGERGIWQRGTGNIRSVTTGISRRIWTTFISIR